MPVVTCPKCLSKYDPGLDEELDGIDPSVMSFKVICPVCAQWMRLPEHEAVDGPNVPPELQANLMAQSRLIEPGPDIDVVDVADDAADDNTTVPTRKKPWWRFW